MSSSKRTLLCCFLFCLLFTVRARVVKPGDISVLQFLNDNGFESQDEGLVSKTATKENGGFKNFAILVAGSKGYSNYRHQADICHAYQLLRKNGMSEDQIITFVYNDIVDDPRNPYPGKLFNRPGGEDVYPGCAKDYVGDNVDLYVLRAVLLGNSAYVQGKGSGRVLPQHAKQRLFIVFSSLGATGYLSFPHGPSLTGSMINIVTKYMRQNKAFRQMWLYVDSPYSGSVFKGTDIEQASDVLVVTATNETEVSYATYCPTSGESWWNSLEVTPETIGVCLGNLFTVSWIEDTEKYGIAHRIIRKQVEAVAQRTSDSGTYKSGSHVSQYGDTRRVIVHDRLALFMAHIKSKLQSLLTYYLSKIGSKQWNNFPQQDIE